MKPEREGEADGDEEGMRSVWRAMRDEEPPARGLDALMAAAGAKAAEMRKPLAAGTRPPDEEARPVAKAVAPPVAAVARRSWWARAPVLAFASAVVLVGGVWVISRRADAPVERGGAAPSPAQTAPAAERLQAGGAPPPAVVPADASPPVDAPPVKRAPAGGPPAKKGGPSNAALLRDAEAAAERGDCARARKLVAQIFRSEVGPRTRALPAALARCMDE